MSDLKPDKNTSVFLDGVFSRKERKDHKAGGPTSVSATIDRSGWKRVRLGDVLQVCHGKCQHAIESKTGKYPILATSGEIGRTDSYLYDGPSVLIGRKGTIDKPQYIDSPFWTIDTLFYTKIAEDYNPKFLYYLCLTIDWASMNEASGVPSLSANCIESLEVTIPDVDEQDKIANAITSIDTHISALQSLITKYEAIKKATVNLLLEPKAGWKRMKLDEICMCLDNYREPVNEVERASMHGDIPYCGANGIVDYVNDFTIDDSIILIAEDGGYFDQYESRPIAYRMSGKAWINNHAHILKAKRDYCQDFIFYSLEHKDITPFITSGTRAKLTKGELSNIEIDTPPSFQEQRKIAEKIIAIDNALADYKAQLEKARKLKAGMMSYFFG